jgi:hypothetical protein
LPSLSEIITDFWSLELSDNKMLVFIHVVLGTVNLDVSRRPDYGIYIRLPDPQYDARPSPLVVQILGAFRSPLDIMRPRCEDGIRLISTRMRPDVRVASTGNRAALSGG